ncbi:MAG: cytochrome c oxidase assembly protein [Candidatus Muproteobacteria bacterium RIFCSPHIGHO2_12_FULL_60_33]|uniref:Cytochrome c oxidase assembly protein CtaG n=1 Tax=Candidatus Muproteobacteria bacterium RIFCSPLOWO2_01_FULL_60_18 TaxID=1817768 RepID=A0A1F6U4J4_9PROT|nr:MAG: cytochrome c oxidase assembly protein [Candidatus Muproteobacteria bacterium RIFCSPHIGHO2_01_60_12]OGI52295.1 MAG: cytochrome c oxidase assembly protein [Candidatus Muproteobacteria bacterium RIFCSPLOWO2_01_FULL_60_18]OGI54527.1 MAG: cytochrome c oxidase assembly protein [Candidatus Muproteobacteria bacterium RIFCSPHIGHO2_02_FULL_60_13]OGI54555.1 MAG: cytochrome c oxidase assembly protein [Candidatus Muproteobacteria bacterium RIFCSPHIGHO2_12_FULL_60_33]
MTTKADIKSSNRRLARNLLIVAVAMFGFGYALSPMYDLMCKAFGLNGKTGRIEEQAAAQPVDTSRTVTVEFTGLATSGLPWEFKPLVKKMEVHPGETTEVKYLARNLAQEEITGQAIPSVSPGISATHFNKIECFCFTQQTLRPGESREMPVRFVVDAGLDKDVHTITLSYSFFNTDKLSAKKYGGEALGQGENHAHRAHPAMASGS